MIQNMKVYKLNPDGTRTELYRSNPGDSEQTIMENIIKTFPTVPEDNISASDSNQQPCCKSDCWTAFE